MSDGANLNFCASPFGFPVELGDDPHIYEHLRDESFRLIPRVSRYSNVTKPIFPLRNLNFDV